MERSTIWSLSSPGGRLFGDSPRITFITRSEGGCAAASPSPAAAPTPPNAVEPVAPYLTLPCVDDPGSVLYDYAAIAPTPPPRVAIVQALMRERQRDALRAAEQFRRDVADAIDMMAPKIAPAPPSELDRHDLAVIDESGEVRERVFRDRVNQDRLYDLTGSYPLWTADDTSSCDDCPVRSYADLSWRDQGDEREVL